MMKIPPRIPSAIPALAATSEPPLEGVEVDVDDAEVSDVAAALVVELVTGVEEDDELDVDKVEVAATSPPPISLTVIAESSMAVGKAEDKDEVEALWSARPLLMPFAVSNPAFDDAVLVSWLASVELKDGESVVKSPPVHPADVIVV